MFQQSLPTFDNITPEREKPRRLSDMYHFYGLCKEPGRKCESCVHLFARKMSRTYYKCDLTVVTWGPASDWRVNWGACGMWRERSK